MKSAKTSIIAGIALMAAGVLLLLDLLGILDSAALVWPLIFAAAGTAFLTLFFRSRDNWWAAIPGSVFLGLAAVVLVTQLWPGPAATGRALSCSCSWARASARCTCANPPTGGR